MGKKTSGGHGNKGLASTMFGAMAGSLFGGISAQGLERALSYIKTQRPDVYTGHHYLYDADVLPKYGGLFGKLPAFNHDKIDGYLKRIYEDKRISGLEEELLEEGSYYPDEFEQVVCAALVGYEDGKDKYVPGAYQEHMDLVIKGKIVDSVDILASGVRFIPIPKRWKAALKEVLEQPFKLQFNKEYEQETGSFNLRDTLTYIGLETASAVVPLGDFLIDWTPYYTNRARAVVKEAAVQKVLDHYAGRFDHLYQGENLTTQ